MLSGRVNPLYGCRWNRMGIYFDGLAGSEFEFLGLEWYAYLWI